MSTQIDKKKQRKFYATDDEYQIISNKSKTNGLSISEWIVITALNKQVRKRKHLSPPVVEPQLMRSLTYISNNLNQLTKTCHIHANNDTLNLALVAFELNKISDSLSEIQTTYTITDNKHDS